MALNQGELIDRLFHKLFPSNMKYLNCDGLALKSNK